MYKRIIAVAMLALTAAVAVSVTGAFGKGGGRLELYLVNSGPNTRFFNDSTAADGNCDPVLAKPASLSTSKGTSLQQDNPDGSSANPARASVFSYTVPAGGGFTIPQLNVPAGTPTNTLFNVHVGVASPVNVGAGDTITLRLRSPLYYLPIQWSAPNGPGVSALSILTG